MVAHKGKKKRLLRVLCLVAAGLSVFFCFGMAANRCVVAALGKRADGIAAVAPSGGLIPAVDAQTGYYTFTTDAPLRILQLTDIHLGAGWMSYQRDKKAMTAVETLVRHTKPDLIILTGDMVYPVPVQSGTVNNRAESRLVAKMIDAFGIPWTAVFGNHDTEAYSLYNRDRIAAVYESDAYKNCLFTRGPKAVYGEGNQVIVVKNTSGLITQSLVLIDSNAYIKGSLGKYDSIHPDQLKWYTDELARLDALNREHGATEEMKSLLYFHIPPEEFKNAWYDYKAGKDSAVFRFGALGERGREVFSPHAPDDTFETILRTTSTQGVFVGHDHLNNYSIDYNGGTGDRYVRLTYGMSIDYLAYPGIWRKTAQRGATVATVHPDGGFEAESVRLRDLKVIE
jgi:predicted phosphodiesterase